jgi:hypothetical protein
MNNQSAEMINNIARDQFNYVQRRDSLLRDIAASRTKGRWLILVGAVTTLAGFAMFAASLLRSMSQIAAHKIPVNPFGSDVAGLPSGLLGWAIALVGVILLIVGIVLHVVTTARRRQVDRDMPSFVPPRF